MKNKRVLGMISALLAIILVAVVYPMLNNKMMLIKQMELKR